MTIGTCSCEVGKDGSPCKHQYMLWAAERANCINFIPIASPKDRQNLAQIAIGEALPLSFYTSLRDTNPPEMDTTAPLNQLINAGREDCEISDTQGNQCENVKALSDSTAEETVLAAEAVTAACNVMCAKLKSCQDKNLAKGMFQFAQRVNRLASSMHGNLTSALFNFGANELRKGKNGKKIKVQPNRKRKSGNGSRQAVGKGRPVALGIPHKKPKRDHRFAMSVKQNVNVAKKSGSHVMKSKTKH